MLKVVLLVVLGAAGVLLGLGPAPGHAQDRVLRVAWSLQAPYQFLQVENDSQYVTGIDVTTFRRAAANAGLTVVIRELPWEVALRGVEDGDVDVVLAAFRTQKREDYGYFSRPLRLSQEKLFLPGKLHPTADSAEELLAAVAQQGLRIGFVEGYELGERFRQFRERHPGIITAVAGIDHLLYQVAAGDLDGFILDRFAGYHQLSRLGLWEYAPHEVSIHEAEVSALFSRMSVESSVVERFDAALVDLQKDGSAKAIERRFVLPVMTDIALYGAWFEVILILGMIAFSIAGVVIARSGDYSIYGAVVLASLPALGGGVVRDLLILREPYIFSSPIYIQILLGTLVIGWFFNRLLDLVRGRSLVFFDLVHLVVVLRRRMRPELLMQISDAAGMSAYSIAAVAVAVEFGRDPLWLWGPVLAVLTATGGAILRDMIRPDNENDILRGASWGEAVVLWCLPLCLYLQYFGHLSEPETIFWALMISMIGIFATRVAFIIFGWRAPRY